MAVVTRWRMMTRGFRSGCHVTDISRLRKMTQTVVMSQNVVTQYRHQMLPQDVVLGYCHKMLSQYDVTRHRNKIVVTRGCHILMTQDVVTRCSHNMMSLDVATRLLSHAAVTISCHKLLSHFVRTYVVAKRCHNHENNVTFYNFKKWPKVSETICLNNFFWSSQTKQFFLPKLKSNRFSQLPLTLEICWGFSSNT